MEDESKTFSSKKNTWETEFINKNKQVILQFYRIFRPNSRFGIVLIFIFSNIIAFILSKYRHGNILASFFYLFFIFYLILLFYNLPDKLFKQLFPPIEDDALDKVSESVLFYQIQLFRSIFNVFYNLKNTLFMRFDILTISGLLMTIFGILLFLGNLPFYLIFHVTFLFLIISLSIMGNYLSRSCSSK